MAKLLIMLGILLSIFEGRSAAGRF